MNMRFSITIGVLFILAGCLLGSDYLIRLVRNSQALASQPAIPAVTTTTADISAFLPAQVSVPSVNLSIKVDPGYYDPRTMTWTLGDHNAYFATVSSVPNRVKGNTYIYGHNTAAVFSPLNNMSIGAEADVTTASNETFVYKLRAIDDSQPTDVTVLKDQNSKPELTLQTCAGLWDQYRRLFIFDLVDKA